MSDEPIDFDAASAERDRVKTKRDEFALRRDGVYVIPSLRNAVIILNSHAVWRGVVAFDELAQRIRVLKTPPTTPEVPIVQQKWAEDDVFWSDDLTFAAIVWCEAHHEVSFSKEIMHAALETLARKNSYHPIRRYLESLQWDLTPRVDTWLTVFMRVEDSHYTRTVGAKWLISAVARAYDPGCKVDHTLIIEGDQRCGKSTILRTLCPNERWFLETGVELGSKDAYHVIAGKWIVELAELESMSRADVARVKAFLTSRIDTYRQAYRRNVIDQRRMSVFAATTNDEGEYLKDDTGGGRFWPVSTTATRLSRLDPTVLEAQRDQLWAEVVHRYKSGEPWHITDAETLADVAERQEDRRQVDPWEEPIAAFLASPRRRDSGVSARDVLSMLAAQGLTSSATNKVDSMKVVRIFQLLGWKLSGRRTEAGYRVKLYRPRAHLSGP